VKFTYAYKSSDGVRHEAAIDAPSRDAAFSALRSQGIKPIKVVAADGSKANGEVRGVRRRVVAFVAVGVAIVAGVVAIVAGVVAFRLGEREGEREGGGRGATALPDSAPRHQIYGDPAIMEDFERGYFESVFSNRVDQMLAWFAQPGKLMCPKDTALRKEAENFSRECGRADPGASDEICPPQRRGEVAASNFAPMARVLESDTREVRELKQIVNGMRVEMAEYLANGNGTPRSYWSRLIERTAQEAQIYERTRLELANETNAMIRAQKNDGLRRLGLRTIPNPKEEE